MDPRKNPLFRACVDCGKVMVVTEEAQKEIEKIGEANLHVPAPIGLELQEAVTGDLVVPDYTDVMIGWRAWHVEERPGFAPQLLSMNSTRWEPREVMEAVCARHENDPKHGVPTLSCRCGLYSAKSREHLLSMPYHYYDPDEGIVVIGEVNLWGRIVEGTQGWRAQYGYPRKLFLPFEGWRLFDPLSEAYGVPVELNNTLKRNKKKEAS